MLVVILPGFSSKNEEESQNIADFLEEKGLDVLFHTWPHWDDDSIEFDPTDQAEELFKEIEDSEEEQVIIVAKSIGTYVAMKLLKMIDPDYIDVSSLVLMGIPLNDIKPAQRMEYKNALGEFEGEINLVHNENDPHGSLSEVRALLEDFDVFETVKLGHDDHRYDYPETVFSLIEDYLDDDIDE